MQTAFFKRFNYARILVKEITLTDFKLRYHDSVLGYVWSILKPLAFFAILYVVFARVFKVGDVIPFFSVYLLLGIVLWSYFTEVTTNSLASIVEKGDLIRKINFPKYIIVVSKTSSSIINLVINLTVVLIFMVISGADPSKAAIFVPFLILELVVFGLGVSLILSSLYVKFRDLGYIWEVLVQALFYATPILYPLSFVSKNFSALGAQIIMLNPAAQVIQDMRAVLVTPETLGYGNTIIDSQYRLIPIAISIITLGIGLWLFKKSAPAFAEYV